MSSRRKSAVQPGLRVRLFGVPSVEWNGSPVSIGVRPLCAVLLAMVVLAEPDRRLSRKAVAADLWPDDDETAAANNLRRHLSFLIAALPVADECIARDREALWCPARSAPWCDVVEFERGNLELYCADFMAGFTHEWVLAERERLRLAAVSGLIRVAHRYREDDDYSAAIAGARRAIEIDPIDESIAQLEIELHGERGDIAAVESAFALLKRRLHEIDAEPSSETAALVDRFHLLARDATARIPRPASSFVESSALADVAELVPMHRLVTIVGPGGVGKTRLALEVALRLGATFADGAYFVDLSTVTDPDALPSALSRALGASTDLASKGLPGVGMFLRNRRALLLLDNCEQIAEPCSWFLRDLLESAPNVHVIATSREAFGLRAERCYSLQPLSSADAARLFVERARGVAWSADGIAEETPRIVSICRRLDRLPLALELAASMLGTLSLADVERQLDDGIEGLRSRDPTAPQRHRSLLDVIAWSESLLDDRERTAFARLTVFAGSFSAEAARAVCAVDRTTLGDLVAKSVLVRDDALEGRFVFLNSVAEYGSRLFDADSQAIAIRDAHAGWYASVAMRSNEVTFWKSERIWLREIDRDFPNGARALEWSILGPGAPENGFRLAIGLTHYFARRGFFADGVSWIRSAGKRAPAGSSELAQLTSCLAFLETRLNHFESALEHARAACIELSNLGLERDTARALNTQISLLLYLGRKEQVEPLVERALSLARRTGDVRTEAMILSNVAYVLTSTEDPAAREAYVVALQKFNEAGDDGHVAATLNCIAAFDYNAGRYDAANENLKRALDVLRDLGDLAQIAGVSSDLGDVAFMEGAFEGAHAYYSEALALCSADGSQRTHASVLSGFAALAMESGRARDAARLLGAARPQENASLTHTNLRIFDRVRALVEATVGAEECALEMRFGRDLSRKDFERLARSVPVPRSGSPARV